MHEGGFFYQALIYLSAAVISVPIAKRLGLGSVLGYLIAGIIIGPFALGLIGEEGQDVMHFAEFGVVMMLFLIGLELQPALLWKMRVPILGLGGIQVLASAIVILVVGLLAGLKWQTSAAIGMTLSLSSTAIVLQTLNEKGIMKTEGGQNVFSVLLFQDIAVIPMLALFPLLALPEFTSATAGNGSGAHSTIISDLPVWGQTLAVLFAVLLIIAAGKYFCLLYTSPSPRDRQKSRMPSSA
jgi:Kef-type K+ transport system membrane component KefB